MIEKIFKLMRENNISQYKLAKELNMPTSIFTNWKNGKAKPSIDTIVKIAKYFDVSLDYLAKDDTVNIDEDYDLDNEFDTLMKRIYGVLPREELVEHFGYKESDLDLWETGKEQPPVALLELYKEMCPGASVDDVVQYKSPSDQIFSEITAKLDKLNKLQKIKVNSYIDGLLDTNTTNKQIKG